MPCVCVPHGGTKREEQLWKKGQHFASIVPGRAFGIEGFFVTMCQWATLLAFVIQLVVGMYVSWYGGQGPRSIR